uniref:Galactosamine-containing minor teichoic acid biosynthesis protein n=1 Tax=Staphylococcus epidermidis TaxID=1282 RepID=D2JCX8_STAEP|nr:galactosamine-containing minor teichoic acid biosynthesis protein [Staphylococcus epidermidis]
MIKINFFNTEYGVIKSYNYEKITVEIFSKTYHFIESDFKSTDNFVSKINTKDILIGSFQLNNCDYYLHIKDKRLYLTPYLNGDSPGSLNLFIKKLHPRFSIQKTKYSFIVKDTYSDENIEINSNFFVSGRTSFINEVENEDQDPYIYLKISCLNYVTFLEYTIAKKDFSFKTTKINVMTNSPLKFKFQSANNLIISAKKISQNVKLSDIKMLKSINLNSEFKNIVNDSIILKINERLYIVNCKNEKINITTDKVKDLLYKNSTFTVKKSFVSLIIKGKISYNTEIRPNTLLTKEGTVLSELSWLDNNIFVAKVKIRNIKKLLNVHNTVFLGIGRQKLHPLHYTFNEEQKVLLTFNSTNHAIIARKNAGKNLSLGNLSSLKIYSRWHKLKILIAKKYAQLYRIFNKNKKINVYFEKEASKAVESGRYVFEKVLSQKHLKSKNVFILDKHSEQYHFMKSKYRNNIIDRFSFKNYLYVFLANHFISSELSNHVINTRIFNDSLNKKIKETPLYFLQHGILFMKPHDNPKISGFHKKNMTNNIIKSVVSSDLEAYEFKIMGYNEFDMMKTGLPKLDKAYLDNNADKITYMPTWRPWEESEIINGNIKKTTYYKSILDVIKAFEEENMLNRLQIAAHNKFSQYMKNNFDKYQNIFIEDPTDTLTNSIIYITDISSIILDAAYRGAYPIFYWKEFDYIIEKHGGTSPVNSENAPGDVVYSEKDLVNLVKHIINNNYKIPSRIKNNYKKLNEFNDNQNTKRVVNILLEDNII